MVVCVSKQRVLFLICMICMICTVLLSGCKPKIKTFQGYVDADLVYLSSNYPGRLEHLWVQRGAPVKQQQRLFQLEQTSERFQISMSQQMHLNLLAQQQALRAQIHYQELIHQRTQKMAQNHAASQNDLDLAIENVAVLKSQLQALDAQLQSNQVDTSDKHWQLERKEGVAAEAGVVFDTYYVEGEYIQAGQPVLALITPAHIKAIFYVPEPELSQIHLQGRVRLRADGTSASPEGYVAYISNVAQYTPPIIYSQEERAKLVYRVEVKLPKLALAQWHLGQPVTLDYLG